MSGSESLPESLDVVANRDIDTLAPRARQVLRQAAVLGRDFEEQLLSEVLESQGLEFDVTMRRDLGDYLASSGDGRLQFRHALIREAAYEGLSYRRRRELHGAAGRIVERRAGSDTESRADVLSLHFSRAQEWGKTWRYARLAGKRAQLMFAPAEVALQLERAVDAARFLPGVAAGEVAAEWRELGEARLSLGYYRRAEDAYRKAAQLVTADPVAWGRNMERWARVVGEFQRKYRSSIRLVHRALARLELEGGDGAQEVAVQLLVGKAEIRARQGRLHDALRLSREVVERAQPVGELRAAARAYALMDEALLFLGRANEATHLSLALEIYERLGDRRLVGVALSNLGLLAFFEGRWEDAISLLRRAAEVSFSAGDIASAAMSEMNVGEIFGNQGRLDEANAALRRATKTFRGLGYATLELAAVTQLGRVAAELGLDEDATDLLKGAIEAQDPAAGALAGIEAHGFLAEAHVLAGRPFEAQQVVATACARVGSALDGTPAGVLLDRVEASALAAMGESAAPIELIDRALPVARATGTYFEVVALLALRSSLDGETEPPELVEERKRLIDQLGIVALPALGASLNYGVER